MHHTCLGCCLFFVETLSGGIDRRRGCTANESNGMAEDRRLVMNPQAYAERASSEEERDIIRSRLGALSVAKK